MNTFVVGVGSCCVSNDPAASLVTYALGSCIAIAVYDPVACVGGLLHFMLPASSLDPVRAARTPYLFADTGIPSLFHSAYRLGAVKSRMGVTAAGGAHLLGGEGFQIGERNRSVMEDILERAGVRLQHAAVGGAQARSLHLQLESGTVLIKTAGAGSAAEPVLLGHSVEQTSATSKEEGKQPRFWGAPKSK